MKDFTFYNPTKIEFGKDKENLIGKYMAPYEVKKVLVVYGSNRIIKSGLLGKVTQSLSENNIEFLTLGGVKSNPIVSKAREGVKIVKENHIDSVLAIGGGSVIDTAKAIAAGAVYEGDIWELFKSGIIIKDSLKIFTILTLSASASEMNNNAVMTNEETTEKLGFSSPFSFPTISIISPELQSTVTNDYLAYSAVDVFSHCLDLYFTATYLPQITANYIENILQTIMRTTDILLKNPNDYEARSEFLWAATEALNQSTSAGVEGNRFDTHLIEHSLSGLYNVPHGAGLAIVLPAWMSWNMPMNKSRYERFSQNIFGCQTAEEGIQAMIDWLIRIGAPVKLEAVNISKNDIEKIAEHIYSTVKLWGMQGLFSKEILIDLLDRM